MRTCGLVGVAAVLVLALRVGLVRADPGTQARPDRVAGLIRQLSDDSFARREAASRELAALGEPALAALRQAAASSNDPEIRRRAERLVPAIVLRASRADQKKLEGTWAEVSCEENGKPGPVHGGVLVITSGSSAFKNETGLVVLPHSWIWRVVDATVTPKRIDLYFSATPQVFQAIYELKGDTLRYCGSYTKRPADFATREGDGRYRVTLTRVTE